MMEAVQQVLPLVFSYLQPCAAGIMGWHWLKFKEDIRQLYLKMNMPQRKQFI